MAVAREIKLCDPKRNKETESELKTLEKDRFIVLRGRAYCFLIISSDKSLEEVDDAIFKLLKGKSIGFRNENSFE